MKMRKSVIAFALAVPVTTLTAHAADPPQIQKPPAVLPKQPSGPIGHAPVIRVLTSLKYHNGYIEIGEEKDLVAMLSRADGAPIAGKKVSFNLYDQNGKLAIPLGSAVTNDAGRANLVRARITEGPGRTVQVGQFVMRTEFSGDTEFMPARGEGSFLVQKGSTRCKVGKSRDGAATAYLLFGKASASGVDELPESEIPTFTVNGVASAAGSWRYVAGGFQNDWALQGKGPWNIKMTYKGSALYHPCAGERTITNTQETTHGGPH